MISLLLVVGYFTAYLVHAFVDIGDAKDTLRQKQTEEQQAADERDRLQAVCDSDNKDAYIEDAARRQGLVYQNEKVFYDVTPGA